MLKIWLAREQRRIVLTTQSRILEGGPTRSGLNTLEPIIPDLWERPAKNPEDAQREFANRAERIFSAMYSEGAIGDIDLRRHYTVANGKSKICFPPEKDPGLTNARLYHANGGHHILRCLESIVDGLCLSAVLLVAAAAHILLSIWRFASSGQSKFFWGEIVHECSGPQSSRKPSWDRTHYLDRPSFCRPIRPLRSSVHQATLCTPKASISATDVTIKKAGSSFEVQQARAYVGDPSQMFEEYHAIGRVAYAASVSYLLPDDENMGKAPDFHQIWDLLSGVELRDQMMQRVNGLFRPESAQQVVSAINDSCNLDWFNNLLQELPDVLGTRSFSFHTGVLVATEDATYAVTRGNVQLFALKSSGMYPITQLAQQKAIVLAPGAVSDSAEKKVLRVPHAGNEGTIFVLATSNSLDDLDETEQHNLFHWASAQDGQGPLSINIAEPNRIGRELGPLAAAFLKVMPKLELRSV